MTRERIRRGAIGEELATAFVRARGYLIVTRNFRCALGEIDLVALDDSTIVFCEIRTRRGGVHGGALESVTPAKQRQVVRVASAFVARHRLHTHPIRFDVVAIDLRLPTVTIEHVADAFQA